MFYPQLTGERGSFSAMTALRTQCRPRRKVRHSHGHSPVQSPLPGRAVGAPHPRSNGGPRGKALPNLSTDMPTSRFTLGAAMAS